MSKHSDADMRSDADIPSLHRCFNASNAWTGAFVVVSVGSWLSFGRRSLRTVLVSARTGTLRFIICAAISLDMATCDSSTATFAIRINHSNCWRVQISLSRPKHNVTKRQGLSKRCKVGMASYENSLRPETLIHG